MRGTLVCGVSDTEDGRSALETAIEVSERTGMRLVLAHVGDGIGSSANNGIGEETVAMKTSREGAARLLRRLSADYGVAESAERRTAIGDTAALLAQIAAEEAADLIVIGSRMRGRLRRGLQSPLAEQLAAETPIPVLVAPPRGRRPEGIAA